MAKENKEINLIAKLILERLSNMDKWGGAHSELKKVTRSLPNYLKESHKGRKQVIKAVKLLKNLGYLLTKPSTGEIHCSLNPKMNKEIFMFIEKNERKEYKSK